MPNHKLTANSSAANTAPAPDSLPTVVQLATELQVPPLVTLQLANCPVGAVQDTLQVPQRSGSAPPVLVHCELQTSPAPVELARLV